MIFSLKHPFTLEIGGWNSGVPQTTSLIPEFGTSQVYWNNHYTTKFFNIDTVPKTMVWKMHLLSTIAILGIYVIVHGEMTSVEQLRIWDWRLPSQKWMASCFWNGFKMVGRPKEVDDFRVGKIYSFCFHVFVEVDETCHSVEPRKGMGGSNHHDNFTGGLDGVGLLLSTYFTIEIVPWSQTTWQLPTPVVFLPGGWRSLVEASFGWRRKAAQDMETWGLFSVERSWLITQTFTETEGSCFLCAC